MQQKLKISLFFQTTAARRATSLKESDIHYKETQYVVDWLEQFVRQTLRPTC